MAKRAITGQPRANIYEVARKAGVSFVTVSRTFNNYRHVSPAMRARVLAAARAVGYQPKFTARRRSIAVLIGDLMHLSSGNLYSVLAMELVSLAARRDYQVEFLPVHMAEMVTQNLADGVVALGLNSEELPGLRDLPKVPKVVFGPQHPVEGWHSIMVDPSGLVVTAVRHLQDMGHRRLTLVHDHTLGWLTEQRRLGFWNTLRSANLESAHDIHGTATSHPAELARQVKATGSTACLCLCAVLALPLLDALQNGLRLRVPDELSLVALEHKFVSAYVTPRLTTIAVPLEAVATALLNQMESQDHADARPDEPTVIPGQLILRDSVRRLNAPSDR